MGGRMGEQVILSSNITVHAGPGLPHNQAGKVYTRPQTVWHCTTPSPRGWSISHVCGISTLALRLGCLSVDCRPPAPSSLASSFLPAKVRIEVHVEAWQFLVIKGCLQVPAGSVREDPIQGPYLGSTLKVPICKVS